MKNEADTAKEGPTAALFPANALLSLFSWGSGYEKIAVASAKRRNCLNALSSWWAARENARGREAQGKELK